MGTAYGVSPSVMLNVHTLAFRMISSISDWDSMVNFFIAFVCLAKNTKESAYCETEAGLNIANASKIDYLVRSVW